MRPSNQREEAGCPSSEPTRWRAGREHHADIPARGCWTRKIVSVPQSSGMQGGRSNLHAGKCHARMVFKFNATINRSPAAKKPSQQLELSLQTRRHGLFLSRFIHSSKICVAMALRLCTLECLIGSSCNWKRLAKLIPAE
eukprot:229897-Chlamydomonas_euryale.AAC.5